LRLYRPSGGALPGAWSRKGRADLRVGPRRPPMRAALRRCRKGRMTGSDWREPVRTHVSLGTSMPKITGILKIYPPQRSAGGVWETRSKAEGFPHGTFQGAQRACGCGKPPNEMVWDGASSPGFSMAASRPLGWGRTCPLASVPDMPVRKVSIRRWMARMAEKEPIRVRMGSGISGLSLKVVNRWYGRRSACARGATPCGLAGFAPTFKRKVRKKTGGGKAMHLCAAKCRPRGECLQKGGGDRARRHVSERCEASLGDNRAESAALSSQTPFFHLK